MPVAPEGEWTIEVRFRGSSYGTEAQARATAERWHSTLKVATQRDLELLDVVIRDPRGRRTDECEAVVLHGPGHQSKTRCGQHGSHELHQAHLDVAGHTVYWRGLEGCTGAFDESPLDEDDPYTYVDSKGYWVACCRACDDGHPHASPFKSSNERDHWTAAHASATGHGEFHLVDPVTS